MDISMPVMNGYDCTIKIRDLEKENNFTNPSFIVGLTAHNSESIKSKCFTSGMNDFSKTKLICFVNLYSD